MKNVQIIIFGFILFYASLIIGGCGRSQQSPLSNAMSQNDKEALERSGYQIKEGKVFYNSKEIEDCNSKTFRRIGEFHWTDNKYIFWAGKRLPEADVKTFTTDNGFPRDKNNVYSRDKIIVDADPLTFGITADSLIKTKQGYVFVRDSYFIYHRRLRLTNVDFETFEVLITVDSKNKTNWWAKDKHSVYWNSYVVEGADAETITILNDNQAKDKDENYFILNKTKVKIDPSTFVNFPNRMIKSDTGVYSRNGVLLKEADPESFTYLNKWYQKDINSVFYQTKIVDVADRNSFLITQYLDYAHDKDNVFFRGSPIKGIDRTSWKLLSKRYSKDKYQVYYQRHPMKDADPDTFEVIYIEGEEFGKDKNGTYRFFDRI